MAYQANFGPLVHPDPHFWYHFLRARLVVNMVEMKLLAHGQNPLGDSNHPKENTNFPHFGVKCHTQKICFPTLKFFRTKVLQISSVWSTNFFTRPCGSRRGAKKFVDEIHVAVIGVVELPRVYQGLIYREVRFQTKCSFSQGTFSQF